MEDSAIVRMTQLAEHVMGLCAYLVEKEQQGLAESPGWSYQTGGEILLRFLAHPNVFKEILSHEFEHRASLWKIDINIEHGRMEERTIFYYNCYLRFGEGFIVFTGKNNG